MSYNVIKEKDELQQRICNIISYVFWLYEKGHITERTRNELLKLCNPSLNVGDIKCNSQKKK